MAGSKSFSSVSKTHSTIAFATSTTNVAIWLVLLLSLLEVTSAQNIHFSNGWYPGKKRSSPTVGASLGAPSGTAPGTDGFSACAIRPDLTEIIHKLIMDEIIRLHNTCSYGVSRGLRDLLEASVNKVDKW